MQLINSLTSDALDSQKFVDRMKADGMTLAENLTELGTQTRPDYGPITGYENRQQRRARERAEAKAARKEAAHGQR